MGLKINLKAREKLLIGGAVVTNGNNRAEFVIENNVPVLREKDILSPKQADTPCKKIYLSIQLMYVDEQNLEQHQRSYWSVVNDVVAAAPSTLTRIEDISREILAGRYYQALKLAKELIAYEEEMVRHVWIATSSL